MIHFPHPWLRWLEETSQQLCSDLSPIERATVIASFPEIEFRIHMSLFAIRKIEESIGVKLELARHNVALSWWPVTEEGRAEVCRSSDPDLSRWYGLQTSQHSTISYKRLVDLFIHARICNIGFASPTVTPLHDIGIFVASEQTMKERVFFVPIEVVNRILMHTISIFRPIIERRARRRAEP